MMEKILNNKWLKIGLLSVVGLVLAAGLVFAGVKLGKRQVQLAIIGRPTLSPSVTPLLTSLPTKAEELKLSQCEQDADCLLAIRLDQCCSCPQPVSKEAVQKDEDLVEYEFGKDYSGEMKVDCQGVVCAPCELWNKVICDSGNCKGVYEEEGGEIRIGAEDNGSRVTLEVGQTLVLHLGSNHSTGYGWEIAEIDEAVLKQTHYEYKQDRFLLGSPGKDIWYFQAQAKGRMTLTLNYGQPWEKMEPAFSIEIVVR